MPGSASWMFYAPQGVKGFVVDDDDDETATRVAKRHTGHTAV